MKQRLIAPMGLALILVALLAACGTDDPTEPVIPEPPEGFVVISPGSFTMGAPADELRSEDDERPQHEVTLTHTLFMQEMEVTNQQYIELAQWALDNGLATATPSTIQDAMDGSTEQLQKLSSPDCEVDYEDGVLTCTNPDHPVKMVSWVGAASYCDWLSLKEGLNRAYDHDTWECNGHDPYEAEGYRLPTEAEWEYACRAGTETAFYNGPISHDGCDPVDPVLDEVGWFCGNAGFWSHSVKQLTPNAWGLYDMHGNVWEWCNDYKSDYSEESVTDPVGPSDGDLHVRRGGVWYYGAHFCRSANRHYSGQFESEDRGGIHSIIGFRPVRTRP